MIYDASMFFIISMVTGILGPAGVAAIASQIAWVLRLTWSHAPGGVISPRTATSSRLSRIYRGMTGTEPSPHKRSVSPLSHLRG